MENQTNVVSGHGKDFSQLIELENIMIKLSTSVERAECIAQDLTDTYFSIDVNSHDGMWSARACHQEYSVRADIVFDYLFKMEKEIALAQELIHNEFVKLREQVAV